MPEINLIITDNALRSALLEQLVAFPSFVLNDALTPQEAWANDAKMVICDNAFIEIVALQTTTQKTVFVIGDNDDIIGAEFFPKPFYMGALLDRLIFHSDVVPRLYTEVLSFGPYRLQNRRLRLDGKEDVIRLTEKEAALLEHLAQSDKHVTRDELLAAVWGYDERIDTHTLETHIYHLRRKLNPDGTGDEVLCNDSQGYYLKMV